MINDACIAQIKVEHEPAVSMGPTSIIPAKVVVDNCLLGHTSFDSGEGVEKELLRVNAVALLCFSSRIKFVSPNQLLLQFSHCCRARLALESEVLN